MIFQRKISIYLSLFVAVLLCACEQDLPTQENPLRYNNIVFDSIRTTSDIHYRTAFSIEGSKRELFFDFSEPVGDSIDQRPLVILMHGGGFIQGQRSWMSTLSEMLPLYGYTCANISYRLYDGENFPLSNEDFSESFILARQDLISAIDYFVNHASGQDPYRIDVNNIFIAGASAGAITAVHAITLSQNDNDTNIFIEITKKIENRLAPNWKEGPSVPIRGILSFAGAILDPNWITIDYPDIFCVHGTSDNIVPYSHGMIQITNVISPMEAYGSEIICEKVAGRGKNSVLIADVGVGHISFFAKIDLWQNPAINFLSASLK